MRENILYIALELTSESHDKLFNYAVELANGIDGFSPKFYCHHSTLAFGKAITPEIEQWALDNEGMEVSIVANKIGVSDKAMAVSCDYDAPCLNTIKHVTLAINELTNGKPVDSNAITEWQGIRPLHLTGKVTIYYKQRNSNKPTVKLPESKIDRIVRKSTERFIRERYLLA